MKIILSVHRFLPSLGGTEYSIRYLISEIRNQGHDIVVVTSDEGKYESSEVIDGIKIMRVPYASPSDLINVWRLVSKHTAFYSMFDAALCFDHTFLWLLPIRIKHRLPCVIAWNGYEIPNSRRHTNVKFKIARILEELMANEAVCGGHWMKKYYWTRAKEFYTWPPLIHNDDLTNKENRCIFVGRLADDTSIMNYLECLSILRENYGIELTLDVYGDGPLRNRVEDYITSRKLDVKLHGWKDQAFSMFPKYRFAFTTQWGSMITAMACKCLILAICTTKEQIDITADIIKNNDNGILETTSHNAAKALKNYCDDPKSLLTVASRGYDYATSQTWAGRSQWFMEIISRHIRNNT